MIYKAEKHRLYRHYVQEGVRHMDPLDHRFPPDFMGVPERLLRKWEDRFFRVEENMEFPKDPRLVNRFCVGADPEFVFQETKLDEFGQPRKRYYHAQQLGLDTLDAFGCDMSGRQAELRAYPSRFVLEVVASLMDTLRWMNAKLCLDNLEWLAPAFYHEDGIGGHIHIGRKRPDRDSVIKSLDLATNILLNANVLDAKGQVYRRNGHYGKFGDWRPQSHGYEYRTTPTWMCSPWVAYFTLVIAKLCVLEGDNLQANRPMFTLQNLLRAYRDRDDDAKIACMALKHFDMPVHSNLDFKGKWGVAPAIANAPKSYYYPPIIKPSPLTINELFLHLTMGHPIPRRSVNEVMWYPYMLPKNVFKVMHTPHTYATSDVAQGLLSRGYANGVQIQLMPTRKYLAIVSPVRLDEIGIRDVIFKNPETAHWQLKFDPSNEKLVIGLPSSIVEDHIPNKDQVKAVRSLLTQYGFFDIFKYGDIDKPVNLRANNPIPEPNINGKVLLAMQGGM